MSEKHGTDRLVPFTDAVVAIAMTLLVLPLVDLAGGLTVAERTGGARALLPVLGRDLLPLLGLAISFFVIARLWWAHHAIFEHVREWTTGLVVVNTLWLFTIVLLPVTTAYATGVEPDWLVSLLYVGTMTASSALLTVLAGTVLRQEAEPDVPSRERFYGNLTTLVAFAVALVICVALPWTYYFPLALLALTGIVDGRVHRRLTGAGRRDAVGRDS